MMNALRYPLNSPSVVVLLGVSHLQANSLQCNVVSKTLYSVQDVDR